MIAPPRKTDLGQEELRKRTRKLSQRHRTVLLLVDGKRSRTELLTLAQQAGCAPGLFDELLAMGMVEEPSVPTVPALLADVEPAPGPSGEAQADAPREAPSAPGPQAVDAAAVAAAAVEAVAGEAPSPVEAAPEPVEHERVEIEIAPPVTGAAAEPPAVPSADEAATPPAPTQPPAATEPPPLAGPPRLSESAPLAEPPLLAEPPRLTERAPVPEPRAAAPFVDRRVADRPVPVERRAARAEAPVAPPGDAPPPLRGGGPLPALGLPQAVAELPPELAPTTAPLDPEQRLLTEVRGLLVGTLLIDGPVSNSLLALRVGRAKSRDELIGLVWEIEHSLARSRRPREARGRLERARDLLGLGNTLVDEDTSFGRDSQW